MKSDGINVYVNHRSAGFLTGVLHLTKDPTPKHSGIPGRKYCRQIPFNDVMSVPTAAKWGEFEAGILSQKHGTPVGSCCCTY